MKLNSTPRRGVTVVESAIVYPLVLFFTVGFLVAVVGIFRYQEVATLSREACRYAAVHGTNYAKNAGVTAPTPAQIYTNVILPKAFTLDPAKLTYAVTYNQSNAPVRTVVASGNVSYVYNTVTVVVTYQWLPEAFFGRIALTSSSSMQMCY
jgi:hypothetical protein